MTEEEYIRDRLDEQQKWHSKKSRSCRDWYKWLKFVEFILSASIPLTTALFWGSTCGKWGIAVTGFAITCISSAQAIWKYQERWIEYRRISESLKREKFLYLSHSGPYIDETTRFSYLVMNVEEIISAGNKTWVSMCHSSHKE